MTDLTRSPRVAKHRLWWPLALTHAGLFAERGFRAFWPLASILMAAVAAMMLGLHDILPLEAAWTFALCVCGGGIWATYRGFRQFRVPTTGDAIARLDRTLPGRPIAALRDQQAIGSGDPASEQVWQAHVARMAQRVEAARPVRPDLRLAPWDPFALRYVALSALVVALLFGSIWRISTVGDLSTGRIDEALAAGPAWEGWIEPPAYTGRPTLYLNDIDRSALSIPYGSEITLRLYGEIGALSVDETISGRTGEVPPATDPGQGFIATRNGRLSIEGSGGRDWDIEVIPDMPPRIAATAPLEPSIGGEFRLPFSAQDDYAVVSGRAEVTLDLDAVVRRHGLVTDPEPRETVILDLPLTITGDRSDFEEILIDELSKHPWAGLPVQITLFASDAASQAGQSDPIAEILPARRFFEPLAAAIIEQRRDLLWSRENAARVTDVLRAVSHRPADVFRSETAYLKLRVAIRQMEAAHRYGTVTPDLQDEMADALWDIAVQIEEGDLSDALERLRRAQDRLAEAIENGATDREIAELMQELREAMQEYMRQLAEQSRQNGQQQADNQNTREITGDQLEEMLRRLQELMEQGRMAEAQELLEQLRRMMENMQIAEGQQGQGQSPGQQAMEGLGETLREQQGLSDDTFGDLQNQFGQGQPGPQGLPGQPGQEGMPGENDLADRQEALREELRRQQENLPGGEAARDALDRAGRAMDEAENALRQDDFAGALDSQSEAIEALREGMRELGEELARQQGQQGQQGEAMRSGDPLDRRDPLGREAGQSGRLGTDEDLLMGDDVYRRARELLDEIRRRSSEQGRPDVELDYLKRLLDRF